MAQATPLESWALELEAQASLPGPAGHLLGSSEGSPARGLTRARPAPLRPARPSVSAGNGGPEAEASHVAEGLRPVQAPHGHGPGPAGGDREGEGPGEAGRWFSYAGRRGEAGLGSQPETFTGTRTGLGGARRPTEHRLGRLEVHQSPPPEHTCLSRATVQDSWSLHPSILNPLFPSHRGRG